MKINIYILTFNYRLFIFFTQHFIQQSKALFFRFWYNLIHRFLLFVNWHKNTKTNTNHQTFSRKRNKHKTKTIKKKKI